AATVATHLLDLVLERFDIGFGGACDSAAYRHELQGRTQGIDLLDILVVEARDIRTLVGAGNNEARLFEFAQGLADGRATALEVVRELTLGDCLARLEPTAQDRVRQSAGGLIAEDDSPCRFEHAPPG